MEALCSDATVSLLTESERASCTSSGVQFGQSLPGKTVVVVAVAVLV